ncbi:uncharacterized protein LOC128983810 [Macrosteles quadrilineatus]|uniref:uncharacterized protein LOC128983810 n=1 Tax=Macrosteles quadrilineatus TaxID=74068 RepID=UPI0023E0ADB4|nr:uncharacterized protein LOC128983810 [Macrosteles quadrilineatus]
MLSLRILVVSVCLVSLMDGYTSQEMFARWKDWYNQKLRPCLRSCPHQSEFVCGFDHGRQRYAVASSSCALSRRNACEDEEYQEVPIKECLAQLKFLNKHIKPEEHQGKITHVID